MTNNLITLHGVSYTNLQSKVTPSICKEEGEYITRSYDSIDSFKEHLLYAIMQQSSVFMAMTQVKEINRLNGYQIFNKYDIYKIKKHFKIEKSKWERDKESFAKNKITFPQKGKIKMQDYQKEKYRELQKGYMKLLSAYQK